ncbi:MAG: erythromycin esterase family protein [Flavobacteriales bacterium]|nr:erythromycin esterase family protein [Flavobacteriales bacterium]
MRLIIPLISIIFTQLSFSQNPIWQVKSIDSSIEDYSDLKFLDSLLKDKRIVALGEQTHYDGATFDAKVRLIKYLHKELGFNVIAFESGVYDCYKADQLIKHRENTDSTNYLNQAIFGVWDNAQVHKLANYIDKEVSEDTPLNMCGFDIQFAGNFAKESLKKDLIKYTKLLQNKLNIDLEINENKLDSSLYTLARLSNYFSKIPPSDTLVLFNTTNSISSAIMRIAEPKSEDIFWKKILELIQIDYRKRYLKKSQRDSVMANNLIWLMDEFYPKEKIIVWSANTHISKSTKSLQSKYFQENKMMGEYLKKYYDNSYYTLGFTSYGGRFFDRWFINTLVTSKPKKKSIESFLKNKEYDYCFIHFPEDYIQTNDEYLNNSKVFGNKPRKMKVNKAFDGLFFINQMYPANY